MNTETLILIFFTLAVLFIGIMGVWAIQRTLAQGFNEVIRGLEEIASQMRQHGPR